MKDDKKKHSDFFLAATTMRDDAASLRHRLRLILRQPKMLGVTLIAVLLVMAAAALLAFAGAKPEPLPLPPVALNDTLLLEIDQGLAELEAAAWLEAEARTAAVAVVAAYRDDYSQWLARLAAGQEAPSQSRENILALATDYAGQLRQELARLPAPALVGDEEFSEGEIAAAITALQAEAGPVVHLSLGYNRPLAQAVRESYLSDGRGAASGVAPGNVLVLSGDSFNFFFAGAFGLQRDWSYILERADGDSPWRLTDGGYYGLPLAAAAS